MKPATITFSKLVDEFQQHYGRPAPPASIDPPELIIWENIAYLDDERRTEAFATLKRSIGTRPEQILAAKHSALAAIGKAGKRSKPRCTECPVRESCNYSRKV